MKFLIAILFLFVFCFPALADSSLCPLTDLKNATVFLKVEDLSDGTKIDSTFLKTTVELRLRQCGIVVVDKQPFNSMFVVGITPLKCGDTGEYSAMITANIMEPVPIPRLNNKMAEVFTWTDTMIILTPKDVIQDQIKIRVNDIMDDFCNDYLKDNVPAAADAIVPSK